MYTLFFSTLKFTDVTAYIIATFSALILGFAIRQGAILLSKWFFEKSKSIDKKLEELDTKAKVLEERALAAERLAQDSVRLMEQMTRDLKTNTEISQLNGRIKELSRMVGGIYPETINAAKDNAEAVIRKMQHDMEEVGGE